MAFTVQDFPSHLSLDVQSSAKGTTNATSTLSPELHSAGGRATRLAVPLPGCPAGGASPSASASEAVEESMDGVLASVTVPDVVELQASDRATPVGAWTGLGTESGDAEHCRTWNLF